LNSQVFTYCACAWWKTSACWWSVVSLILCARHHCHWLKNWSLLGLYDWCGKYWNFSFRV